MIANVIIENDRFIEMPFSSQALYFHLLAKADDDGFIANPNFIRRSIGATEADLKNLVTNGFVIQFETGVIVLRHWLICNSIRKDRYNTTIHQSEFDLLFVNENNEYVLLSECQPSDNQMTTEDKIIQLKLIKANTIKNNSKQNKENEENKEGKEIPKGKESKQMHTVTDEQFTEFFNKGI